MKCRIQVSTMAPAMLLALTLAVPWLPTAGAEAPARAGLVVRFGNGSFVTRCIELGESEMSGYDVLIRSGLDVVAAFDSGMGAAVCKIEDDGCPLEDCLMCDAPNYWSTATRNHLIAKQSGELIIRILLLPSHLDCCYTPIITWITENLPKNTRVNVMFQYRPEWKAHTEQELSRELTQQERRRALSIAKEKGLTNIIT